MRFTQVLFAFILSISFLSASNEGLKIEDIKDNKMALEQIEKQLAEKTEKGLEEKIQAQNDNGIQTETQNDQDDQYQKEQQAPVENDSSTSSYEKAFVKMIIILVIILAIVIGVFFLFRKFSSTRMQMGNHARSIKIIEKRAISPKSMLYLVEIGGQKILLAESQLEIRNVSNLEWIENAKQGL